MNSWSSWLPWNWSPSNWLVGGVPGGSLGSGGLLLALLGAIGGAVAIGWGLWGDRGRGRRCPRCWHDLSGTGGLVCGECGHAGRDEAALHRHRRRWSVVALGLAMMLGATAIAGGLGSTRDLWALVPSRVLVAALPWTSGPAGADSVNSELRRRLARGASLGEGTLAALVERIALGDETARPPSPEWEVKYGSFITPSLLGAIAGREELRRLLRDLPARIELSIASPWPRDLPAYGMVDLRHWWPDPAQLRLVIDAPELPALGESVVGFDTRGFAWRQGWPRHPVEFAAPAPADQPIRWRIRFDRRVPASIDEASGEVLGWSGWTPAPELSLEAESMVAAAPPVAERLAPLDDKVVRTAIAEAFSSGLIVRDGGPRPYALRFDASRTEIPELEDVALGLAIEVLERGEVRRRTWIWWAAGAGVGRVEWRVSWEDHEALARATDHEPEEGRWTLRIRGDPGLAMRAVESVRLAGGDADAIDRCFAGEIEIPLRIVRLEGTFPPRRWFDPTREEPPPVAGPTAP